MKKNYNIIDKKIMNKAYFINLLHSSEQAHYATFLNPFSYNVFLENEEYIEHFDSFFADGELLVKLHNLFNSNKIDRVSFDFSSVADNVLRYADENKLNMAFVGAKKEELEIALGNIKKLYPNINIVFSRDGYFENPVDLVDCINQIKLSDVNILIVGMGSPYQENFVVKIKQQGLSIPLIFTCGGFITQTSIKTDYYHPIIKKLGLRWLQRFIMHKHVRTRLLKDYPLFILKYIANKITKK